jgi:hypothetical protein
VKRRIRGAFFSFTKKQIRNGSQPARAQSVLHIETLSAPVLPHLISHSLQRWRRRADVNKTQLSDRP